jgi:hypothetical protein
MPTFRLRPSRPALRHSSHGFFTSLHIHVHAHLIFVSRRTSHLAHHLISSLRFGVHLISSCTSAFIRTCSSHLHASALVSSRSAPLRVLHASVLFHGRVSAFTCLISRFSGLVRASASYLNSGARPSPSAFLHSPSSARFGFVPQHLRIFIFSSGSSNLIFIGSSSCPRSYPPRSQLPPQVPRLAHSTSNRSIGYVPSYLAINHSWFSRLCIYACTHCISALISSLRLCIYPRTHLVLRFGAHLICASASMHAPISSRM